MEIMLWWTKTAECYFSSYFSPIEAMFFIVHRGLCFDFLGDLQKSWSRVVSHQVAQTRRTYQKRPLLTNLYRKYKQRNMKKYKCLNIEIPTQNYKSGRSSNCAKTKGHVENNYYRINLDDRILTNVQIEKEIQQYRKILTNKNTEIH